MSPSSDNRRYWTFLALASAATTIALILAAGRLGPRALLMFGAGGAILLTSAPAAGQVIRGFHILRPQLSWWHGLILLTFMSGLLFRVRDADAIQDNTLDAWAVYRVGLCAVIGFALVARAIVGKTKLLSSLSKGVMALMLLYCVVSAISALWSVFPAWSLYKSVEFMVDIALVAAIVATVRSVQSLKTLFDWTWILQSLLLASVWIGAAISPGGALLPSPGLLPIQINGIYPVLSANSVGSIAAVIALVAFARLPRARALYGFLLFAAVITVVFAQTRSAIIGLLLGVAVILFFSRRISWIALCAWFGLIVFSQTSAADVFWKYFQRGENQHTFATLSGRVDWWSAGLNRYLERPLTGYGAYTTRFAVLEELGQGETSTIHNAFLEVLFGAGPFALLPLLSAVIWVAFLLFRAVREARAPDRPLAVEAAAVFTLILTRSFFSSGLVWHPDLNFLCILAYAEFVRRKHRQHSVIGPIALKGAGRIPRHVSSYASANPS